MRRNGDCVPFSHRNSKFVLHGRLPIEAVLAKWAECPLELGFLCGRQASKVQRKGHGSDMGGQKIFGCISSKERSAVCDVMREAHASGYRAHGALLIAILQEVKGVKHVEAAQSQGLANIFDRCVRPERVV